MKIFNHGCVNVIWSRGSISEIFVNGYHEFVCGYWEVVGNVSCEGESKGNLEVSDWNL